MERFRHPRGPGDGGDGKWLRPAARERGVRGVGDGRLGRPGRSGRGGEGRCGAGQPRLGRRRRQGKRPHHRDGALRRRTLRRLSLTGVESRSRRHRHDLGHVRPRPADGDPDAGQPGFGRDRRQGQRPLAGGSGTLGRRPLRRLQLMGVEPRSRRRRQAGRRVRPRPADEHHDAGQSRVGRRGRQGQRRLGRGQYVGGRSLRRLPLLGVEPRPGRQRHDCGRVRARPPDEHDDAGQPRIGCRRRQGKQLFACPRDLHRWAVRRLLLLRVEPRPRRHRHLDGRVRARSAGEHHDAGEPGLGRRRRQGERRIARTRDLARRALCRLRLERLEPAPR